MERAYAGFRILASTQGQVGKGAFPVTFLARSDRGCDQLDLLHHLTVVVLVLGIGQPAGQHLATGLEVFPGPFEGQHLDHRVVGMPVFTRVGDSGGGQVGNLVPGAAAGFLAFNI